MAKEAIRRTGLFPMAPSNNLSILLPLSNGGERLQGFSPLASRQHLSECDRRADYVHAVRRTKTPKVGSGVAYERQSHRDLPLRANHVEKKHGDTLVSLRKYISVFPKDRDGYWLSALIHVAHKRCRRTCTTCVSLPCHDLDSASVKTLMKSRREL